MKYFVGKYSEIEAELGRGGDVENDYWSICMYTDDGEHNHMEVETVSELYDAITEMRRWEQDITFVNKPLQARYK